MLEKIIEALPALWPFLLALAVVSVGLWLAHRLLRLHRGDIGTENRSTRQVAMLLLTALGVAIVVLALPIQTQTRVQLLSLLGLLLTAAIALSSTTFLSNAMAGLMLRSVRSFRAGDFIRVGEQFGRVTERGLFHTEIQTEDRDLCTLPNLYLVSNPITVVRASGTIVSCSLSLGYDVPHDRVERLLLEAATAAELQDPFVHVRDLGNFAVTYRVAGFLPEVKHLLSARSTLRRRVLDALHGDGVEIVSPSFMNQRQMAPDAPVIPSEVAVPPAVEEKPANGSPEEIIFDKADEAERQAQLHEEHETLAAEVKTLEKQLARAQEDGERGPLERRLAALRSRAEGIAAALEGDGHATETTDSDSQPQRETTS